MRALETILRFSEIVDEVRAREKSTLWLGLELEKLFTLRLDRISSKLQSIKSACARRMNGNFSSPCSEKSLIANKLKSLFVFSLGD